LTFKFQSYVDYSINASLHSAEALHFPLYLILPSLY
jgi:hypothetical protein